MKPGDKIKIQSGGYAGFNANYLYETGCTPSTELEIIRLQGYGYVVKLPNGNELVVFKKDLTSV